MDFQDLQASAALFGEKKDCGVKAISVGCGVPYADAHAAMELAGRKPASSSYPHMYPVAADLLGCELVDRTADFKNRAKTIRTLQRILPKKNYLIMVRRHALGAANGKVIDWSKGRCHRVLQVLEVIKR